MQSQFGWSLCISCGVVLFSIIPLTVGRIKAGYSIENMSAPRAFFDKLPEFGKRAVWCHQNCWESISLHAPACLFCLLTSVDSKISILSALLHPLLRILYIFSYIFNFPLARGLFWVSGVMTTFILYKEAITQII
tara:strand:- start:3 stop:407 length:405 start_codon:yes stop_codon:yes gene_type:complete